MKATVKAGAAVLAALVLVVVAAAVNLRGEAVEPRPGPSAVIPSGASLLRPAIGARSLEEAIAGLQDRLRAIPDDWRGFATLGLAYVAQARVTADPSWYPKAEGALAESLRLHDEGNVEARLGMGALALARHDFEVALRHGRAARRLNPHGADALGVIGDALVELGRYDEAFDTLQAMVDLRPDLASYARVSYARELLGDVPGAVEAMELAFDAAGTPADAAWAAGQLGELEFGRGAFEDASAWFERGLDLDPGSAPNVAGLAKTAWANGDVELAIERYAEAVERYPSVEYAAALGDLYAVTGRPRQAEDRYAIVEATRSIARANGVDVDLEVALFDADHGDPAAAVAAAGAEWRRRRSVHVADAYAWALYAAGRYREAARMADRALELGTRNAAFLFHAGMIRLALGHDDAARRLLHDALATNPAFSILHAATARAALADLRAAR